MSPKKPTRFSRFAPYISAAAMACGTLAPASAALVLDPASGIELSFTPDLNDDAQVPGSQAISGEFFGFAYTSVIPTISLNGYIFLGGATPSMDPMRLGESGGDRIAPLWYDFGVGASTKIIEHTGTGYYGITWQDLTVPRPSDLATFQAILFSEDTTLGGLSFTAGDIVFSYGDPSFFESAAEIVIGVEEMLGGYAGLPSSNFPELDLQGWHSSVITGDIPVSSNEFARFSPDGNGGYDITVEAIPEPSVSLLMASGLVCVWRRRRG